MMLLQRFIKPKLSRQLEIFSLSEFDQIRLSDVNLVYLKRRYNELISNYIRQLVDQGFEGINESFGKDQVGEVVEDNLTGINDRGKQLFIDDITQISHMLFDVTGVECLRLVLKVVSDDACRKFHTDGYEYRLLCTYLGKGTEWVSDDNVRRYRLIGGSNREIVKDFTRVQSMKPFDVAILKGESMKVNGMKGIVHRSPPIQNKEEKRLLLRLDVVDN